MKLPKNVLRPKAFAVLLISVSASLVFTSCVTKADLKEMADDQAKIDAEFKVREEFSASGDRYTLLRIEKNADRWKGQVFSFDGQVLWIRESADGTTLQLSIGDDATLLVVWPKQEMPDVIKGNTIGVLGSITGTVNGTNAFGGDVEAVGFLAKAYVQKISPGYFAQIGNDKMGDWVDGAEAEYDSWKDKHPPLPKDLW